MGTAAAKCELTPPPTREPNKQGFKSEKSEAPSPIPRPFSCQRGSKNRSQTSTPIHVVSPPTIAQDPTVVCGRPMRASVEDGNEKLPGRNRSRATIPDQISVLHSVELSEEGSGVDRQLVTPPPSSTRARCPAAKPRGISTRKQTASYKQRRQRKPSHEDKAILNSLPEGMRNFTEREMCWSSTAADTDFMLTLPRPNHIYVDGRQRLTFDDSRFSAPPKRKSDASSSCSVLAGIPSKRPYAPHPVPNSTKPTRLVLPKDFCFREITNDTTQEEAFHSRPSVKLIIPDVIKALLVDDWENVTKNTQLVPLPHPKPVTKILEDYSAYEMPKRPANSSHADILEETLSGLKEYFDKSLGRILLYKFERLQYAELHKKWNSTDPEFQGKTASDIYGAEHLCRLIVSLPELIAQTNMDQQSVNRLREELAKFCTWLSKNAADYFTSTYETPGQDYVDKAKN